MYTVIVADDEEVLRRAIIRKIDWESIGFQVIGEAENGIEALELVARLEPDLLLTDIRMPFISGIDLARQVREVRPTTQIAFLSGFDDFSYAQQAIQYNIISYMLKPISMNELTENLKQMKEKIDRLFQEFSSRKQSDLGSSEFLLSVLLDSFQPEATEEREAQLQQQAEACGLLKPGIRVHRYVVMTVSVLNENGSNITDLNHLHAVDSILRKYVKYQSCYVGNRIVSVLMATSAAFDKYLHILVDEISQSIERILNRTSRIGISREVDVLTGLHEAYRESVNAMRYASSNRSSIRYIADEEPFGTVDVESMMCQVSEIENCIKRGTVSELEQNMGNVFERMERERWSKKKSSFLMMELLSCACRLLYASGDDAGEAAFRKDSFMQKMTFLESSVSEARVHFTAFCISVQNAIADQKKKSSLDICERALHKMREEFFNPDLSLVSISSEIGVSPNYLSGLIKKKTGKSFIDYLTQLRMEEAKKLLGESNMRIREIAEQCGYSDQHYFSYCFKKAAGVSPNALRQQLAQETERNG